MENGYCCAKKLSKSMHYKRGNNERKKQRGGRYAGEKKSGHLLCARNNIRERDVKFFGKGEEGYKFLWMREKDKRGGVGILIRIIINIKLVLEGNLMHVISAYAPHCGKHKRKKRNFGGGWMTALVIFLKMRY